MKKIAIFCSEYDENCGGIMVMHYLCHLLREIGVEAYMFPRFGNFLINFSTAQNHEYMKLLEYEMNVSNQIFIQKNYKLNPDFTTPTLFEIPINGFSDEWVIIYPENTIGNPTNAKNIIRWLLAPPLTHSNLFTINRNELIIEYEKGLGKFIANDIKNTEFILNIQYIMIDIYKNKNYKNRNMYNSCFSIRKGQNKKITHDTTKSICIDGLSHGEISQIFNSTEVFISYDSASFYSQYAVMCGAKSIVIPDDNYTLEQWRTIPTKQGIAYGFDDLEWANNTKENLLSYLFNKNLNNSIITKEFNKIINTNFG